MPSDMIENCGRYPKSEHKTDFCRPFLHQSLLALSALSRHMLLLCWLAPQDVFYRHSTFNTTGVPNISRSGQLWFASDRLACRPGLASEALLDPERCGRSDMSQELGALCAQL